MFFKEKKEVIYRKDKETYKIEIMGSDYENERDMEIIMNFIKKISSGKKIFISTVGTIEALDAKVIISVKKAPIHGTPSTIELEINPDEIDAIEPLIYNLYTYIYVFNQSMSWNEFLEMHRVNSYFKNGDLIACIGLYDREFPLIELNKNQNIYMEELFYQLQMEQYTVKRKRYILN